jgi:hypothetical protein
MNFKQKLMTVIVGLMIGSWAVASVAPVTGSLSNYGSAYAATVKMPSFQKTSSVSQANYMPQATLDPEVLQNIASENLMADQTPFMQQKIRPHSAMRGFGAFRSTGTNLMQASSSALMPTKYLDEEEALAKIKERVNRKLAEEAQAEIAKEEVLAKIKERVNRQLAEEAQTEIAKEEALAKIKERVNRQLAEEAQAKISKEEALAKIKERVNRQLAEETQAKISEEEVLAKIKEWVNRQ